MKNSDRYDRCCFNQSFPDFLISWLFATFVLQSIQDGTGCDHELFIADLWNQWHRASAHSLASTCVTLFD